MSTPRTRQPASWACAAALGTALGITPLGFAQTAPVAAATPVAPAPPNAPNAASALPPDSLYHLPAQLQDQNGNRFSLASHQGHPVLVSMFYTSCQMVCPMLVETVRGTLAQLSPADRAQLRVLLVSIDPARDTVAVLKRTADERQLPSGTWQLVRADAPTVRKLAAALGVQYRQLASGEFNHTTPLVLLDAQGRAVARTQQLGQADPAFVQQLRATLRVPH
jgi:protein SCO1